MIKRLFFTLSILLFIGCSVKQPEFHKFNLNSNLNITKKEEEKILRNIIKNTAYFCSRKWGRCAKVKGDTISFWGTNIVLRYRFIIDENNQLKMIDLSYNPNCLHLAGGCKGKDAYSLNFLPNDWGFVDYINNYQKRLAKILNRKLIQYSKFKKEYYFQKKLAEDKLNKLKVKFVDNTHLLSKNIINKIKYKIYLKYNYDPLNVFLEGEKISFKICIKLLSNKIDRYLMNLDKMNDCCKTKNCKNVITFKIINVFYNFLPKVFNASNNDIAVEINNNLNGYRTIKQIKIFNKTNKFIKVDNLVIYYKGLASNNLLLDSYEIAPHSYTDIFIRNLYDFPKKRYVLLHSLSQKVDYGVSASYSIGNNKKSLYTVKRYSINDLLN